MFPESPHESDVNRLRSQVHVRVYLKCTHHSSLDIHKCTCRDNGSMEALRETSNGNMQTDRRGAEEHPQAELRPGT